MGSRLMRPGKSPPKSGIFGPGPAARETPPAAPAQRRTGRPAECLPDADTAPGPQEEPSTGRGGPGTARRPSPGNTTLSTAKTDTRTVQAAGAPAAVITPRRTPGGAEDRRTAPGPGGRQEPPRSPGRPARTTGGNDTPEAERPHRSPPGRQEDRRPRSEQKPRQGYHPRRALFNFPDLQDRPRLDLHRRRRRHRHPGRPGLRFLSRC